jgi:tetratricopeptide (TPR) repeat protein
MKTATILAVALFAVGCANTAKPVAQSNTPTAGQKTERSETAIAHSSERQMAPATAPNSNGGAPASKWSASGDAIDTTRLDAAVVAAEKSLSSKPADDGAKKKLASAFYERAVALTEARQYASALGDYRRAVKYDPSKAEAKEWVDQIVMIYEQSLKRQPPAVGEEPAPLPFKKS